MALWFFDAVPMSLAALVVICVAGGKYGIKIAYSQFSITEVRTSWTWPCRIKEGRVQYLGGCGGRVAVWDCSPNRECNFTVYRELPYQSTPLTVCYAGSRESQDGDRVG